MHQLNCSEVWGGIKNEDLDACSRTVTASLYSSASDGGKGGDIYYVSVCGADKVTRIAVADVVGHGEVASRVSQWLYAALQRHMNDAEGHGVLSELNDLTSERDFEAVTTAAIVAICKADDHAYFSYAGHPPAMLRRRDEARWTSVPIKTEGEGLENLPLGIDRSVSFGELRVPVQSGDRLLLYTDGVIETPDSHGGLFGQERLEAVVTEAGQASLHELKSAVLSELRRYAGGALVHDDVTLLAIEVR